MGKECGPYTGIAQKHYAVSPEIPIMYFIWNYRVG
jgi:hypothetical protein